MGKKNIKGKINKKLKKTGKNKKKHLGSLHYLIEIS